MRSSNGRGNLLIVRDASQSSALERTMNMRNARVRLLKGAAALVFAALSTVAAESRIDFNRDIRPILSQNCFLCHGPDEAERKGKLRLDSREDALKAGSSGNPAIVPGQPEKSELLARVTHSDPDELMPPVKSGKKLSAEQVELLRAWIGEGAKYAMHWAYTPPERSPLPAVKNKVWPRNGLDYFILARLESEQLEPAPEADRYTLARRLSLDLTGLPPSLEEVDRFVNDRAQDAYEKFVDRLLAKESYGEHWARLWLDLARYADSAGYADDPLRTIWRYRDYVIRAFNDNKTFDEFTLEQLAGDLLPEPDEEDLVATAFHRNTMTNNEGGTNDEEFRNAAVVDRVNTTMAVWMGTSMACAQCHTHKYDPITQEEYFQFMAFLNNTEDADRPNESPTHQFYTLAQQKQREALKFDIEQLEAQLATTTPKLVAEFEKWDAAFPRAAKWRSVKTKSAIQEMVGSAPSSDDGRVSFRTGTRTNFYTLEAALPDGPLTALRFVPASSAKAPARTKLTATILPPNALTLTGRFVRIEIPGKNKLLSLAEVQVFSGAENIASRGTATQSSTTFGGVAALAIDGNMDGNFEAKSTTHTAQSDNPWWELDLKEPRLVSRLVLWNRTDNRLHTRLTDFRIALLNERKEVVWEKRVSEPPNPSAEFSVDGLRPAQFAGVENTLIFLSRRSETFPPGSTLKIEIEQAVKDSEQTLDDFRIEVSSEPGFPEYASNSPEILALLKSSGRESDDVTKLRKHYLRNVAPELEPQRKRLAELSKRLEAIKPNTVPIMRELAGDKRRKTQFQFRGNYQDVGKEVVEAVPVAFHPFPSDAPRNRLGLAKWLVDERNPLTARVVANRFWEQIFGVGLVRTSEEFGSQGELPSHPELLDWLAIEFMENSWNVKGFLKMLVTSAAYRQSSRVTPDLFEGDPENRLLARGPRFRIAAEMVRDQALAIAGLLSGKMYGPSVKPPQPASGLSAAFGSSVDWKTSEGEDRYRRGLYTEWRRTSPYPSMSTFDAPNREVCTLRRSRTSTPLQALVTLNDPVYVEAAIGLAGRMSKASGSVDEQIRHGFRLCVARPPSGPELDRLKSFYEEAASEFRSQPENAKKLINKEEAENAAQMAALTTVANVLLNLDETLMKR